MRTENVDLMRKTFWGGGTVSLASSSSDFHVLKCRPSDKFEDGTVSFLDIVALKHGFDFLQGTLGGVGAVHKHVHSLTRHLYGRLAGLQHSNGAPLVVVFGSHAHPNPEFVQGGIVNFEVIDPSGREFSYKLVERTAAEAGFHIRAGAAPASCFACVSVLS
jgi:molybdenum cofactor sulfurtransferase